MVAEMTSPHLSPLVQKLMKAPERVRIKEGGYRITAGNWRTEGRIARRIEQPTARSFSMGCIRSDLRRIFLEVQVASRRPLGNLRSPRYGGFYGSSANDGQVEVAFHRGPCSDARHCDQASFYQNVMQ